MKKFLTVYDYGTGVVWQYIYAPYRDDVIQKFPKLEVLDKEPEWFTDDDRKRIRTYMIDDEPDDFLKRMMKTP